MGICADEDGSELLSSDGLVGIYLLGSCGENSDMFSSNNREDQMIH